VGKKRVRKIGHEKKNNERPTSELKKKGGRHSEKGGRNQWIASEEIGKTDLNAQKGKQGSGQEPWQRKLCQIVGGEEAQAM